MDPTETIKLLDELEGLGFTDEAFQTLHHFRTRGGRPTVNDHRRYCSEHIKFASDGNNERVQRRLTLVLDAYRSGFSSGSPEVFVALAEAAFKEIPCI